MKTEYSTINDMVMDDNLAAQTKAEALHTYERAGKSYDNMHNAIKENNSGFGDDILRQFEEREEYQMDQVHDFLNKEQQLAK